MESQIQPGSRLSGQVSCVTSEVDGRHFSWCNPVWFHPLAGDIERDCLFGGRVCLDGRFV